MRWKVTLIHRNEDLKSGLRGGRVRWSHRGHPDDMASREHKSVVCCGIISPLRPKFSNGADANVVRKMVLHDHVKDRVPVVRQYRHGRHCRTAYANLNYSGFDNIQDPLSSRRFPSNLNSIIRPLSLKTGLLPASVSYQEMATVHRL